MRRRLRRAKAGFGVDAAVRADQASTTCAAACGPTPGWSSSCGASLRLFAFRSRLSSSRSSAVERGAAVDRAQRVRMPRSSGCRCSTVGSCCGQALEQLRAGERPQLAAQRLRCRDQQVAQLQTPLPALARRLRPRVQLQAPASPARSPPARGVAGPFWLSALRAARMASSASVLPPERRSRATGRPRAPARRGRLGSE